MTFQQPVLQFQEAAAAFKSANTILLVTHMFPDGDAIGSLMGLANALKLHGKNLTLAVDAGVPPYLQFIPGSEDILPALTNGQWDVMVSLDCSDEERSGHVGVYGRAHSNLVVNIDHHATNTGFGHVHIVRSSAVSSTEVVFDLLEAMGQGITQDIAVPLLTGLVTDTLAFRISSVTSNTLRIAQRLIDAGAVLSDITARTVGSTDFATILLWKEALPTVQLQDKVVWATISRAMLQNLGIDKLTDSGGLVSFLVSAKEAQASIVFKELEDNQVELSFRSKPTCDVSKVAFALGGGGHKQASGATIQGTLEEAYQRVLPLVFAAANLAE